MRLRPSKVGIAAFQRRHDAQGLGIVVKAAEGAQAIVERALARVPERRVAEIVRKRERLGEILIETERARQRPRDLGDFERVGEPCPVVIAFVKNEDLRLVLSRRKAVAWMMRSQSRRNGLRRWLAGSGCRRPRLRAGSAGIGSARFAALDAIVRPVSAIDAGILAHLPIAINTAGIELPTEEIMTTDGHVTERAARRIGEILRRSRQGAMLRVSVEGGGCSGLSVQVRHRASHEARTTW